MVGSRSRAIRASTSRPFIFAESAIAFFAFPELKPFSAKSAPKTEDKS